MSMHTPGPWEIGMFEWDIQTNDDELVAQVPARGPHWKDDARLITAAPDLLVACERAVQFIVNGIETGYVLLPATEDPSWHTLAALRAAITKATTH